MPERLIERRCKIFNCDHKRSNVCCADCRKECDNRCQNTPRHCGQCMTTMKELRLWREAKGKSRGSEGVSDG